MKRTKYNYYNSRVKEIEADLKLLDDLKNEHGNLQFVDKYIEQLNSELAEIYLLCSIPDEIILGDEDDEA